jgi:LPXTG-site transpeptidase (sortase) family protein
LAGLCSYQLSDKSMQSKTLSKQNILLITIVVSALTLAIIFQFVPKNKTGNIQAIKQEQKTYNLPSYLVIPTININSVVEYVGINSKGEMGVPKDIASVAWFELGTRPGEIGSAVMAGHYGWKNGESSVFDNLSKLRKGDKIYIENNEGVTISFVVKNIKKYDAQEDASDVFISNDGLAHLNLITCVGVWNNAEKSYSDRLVVFTDKEL